MVCKSKERISCIVYRNESSVFNNEIKFVEDRCPCENECDVKCGEPRGLRIME